MRGGRGGESKRQTNMLSMLLDFQSSVRQFGRIACIFPCPFIEANFLRECFCKQPPPFLVTRKKLPPLMVAAFVLAFSGDWVVGGDDLTV